MGFKLDLINKIENVNNNLLLLLSNIQNSAPMDDGVDELVSDLQLNISQRQQYLNSLLEDKTYSDAEFLKQQYGFTQVLIDKSNQVLQGRQSLLLKEKTNKRQINIYKSIDSNR